MRSSKPSVDLFEAHDRLPEKDQARTIPERDLLLCLRGTSTRVDDVEISGNSAERWQMDGCDALAWSVVWSPSAADPKAQRALNAPSYLWISFSFIFFLSLFLGKFNFSPVCLSISYVSYFTIFTFHPPQFTK